MPPAVGLAYTKRSRITQAIVSRHHSFMHAFFVPCSIPWHADLRPGRLRLRAWRPDGRTQLGVGRRSFRAATEDTMAIPRPLNSRPRRPLRPAVVHDMGGRRARPRYEGTQTGTPSNRSLPHKSSINPIRAENEWKPNTRLVDRNSDPSQVRNYMKFIPIKKIIILIRKC